MRYSILVTLISIFAFSNSSHAEDPRSYDVCVIVTKGKTEVLKNKKGVDVEGLIEFHQLNRDMNYVVMARDGHTRVISFDNDFIYYNFKVIGSHYAYYKIAVKDFAAYVTGGENWEFTPLNYTDTKTGKILMLPKK